MSRLQQVAMVLVMAGLSVACVAAPSSPTRPGAVTSTSSPSETAAVAPSAAPTGPAPTMRPVITFPPAAHRPQTIHVFEDPRSFATVPVAGCTSTKGCVGQQLNGYSGMLDWASHAEVGTLLAKCVMTDPSRNLYDCAITIKLTGRGEIAFDESVVIGGNGPQGPWPILSGTGEFFEATGSVGIPADSTCHCGNFLIAITG